MFDIDRVLQNYNVKVSEICRYEKNDIRLILRPKQVVNFRIKHIGNIKGSWARFDIQKLVSIFYALKGLLVHFK